VLADIAVPVVGIVVPVEVDIELLAVLL